MREMREMSAGRTMMWSVWVCAHATTAMRRCVQRLSTWMRHKLDRTADGTGTGAAGQWQCGRHGRAQDMAHVATWVFGYRCVC